MFDVNNKNILITGATSGIGRESALALAKMGANITFIARNKLKAENLLTDIRSSGLWIGCDLAGTTSDLVLNDAYEKGLIMVSAGTTCLRLAPALNIPDEDIERGLEILTEVLGG